MKFKKKQADPAPAPEPNQPLTLRQVLEILKTLPDAWLDQPAGIYSVYNRCAANGHMVTYEGTWPGEIKHRFQWTYEK